MDRILQAHQTLQQLCTSIQTFINDHESVAKYRAPVLDYRHPNDYQQQAIQGLSRFLRDARHELAYLIKSPLPPQEFTSNAPHLVAVWDQFVRAAPPLICISQVLDSGSDQIKIDVVAAGGDEWIKINTFEPPLLHAGSKADDARIKESRLMLEFREQDSYINSDYDSDSPDRLSTSSAERRNRPENQGLTNSILRQAQELVAAAQTFPRPGTLDRPSLRYVLARMSENGDDDRDSRVTHTFDTLRHMGIDLAFNNDDRPLSHLPPHPELKPRPQILLDLSVVVALCCDSTHHPLPRSEDDLEARFRPHVRQDDGTWSLGPHSRTSRDLRDQLRIETEHPLIEEMQLRLAGHAEGGSRIQFWVTQEVKDRLPGIIDTIGGDQEKARGRALFGEGSFWVDSRYQDKAGLLTEIRVRVLDETAPATTPSDTFDRGILAVCSKLIEAVESPTPVSRSSHPTSVQSRNAHRSNKPNVQETVFHSSRWPSAHTLRTLEAGIKRGMTVLTNNRGAVGKVIREMGVMEGLPYGDGEDRGTAKVWVVNPSSLAEWRRVQVEKTNAEIMAPDGN